MALLVITLAVSIALTVFAYGLNASTDALTHLVRHPQLLLASLLSMFVVMPVLALFAILVVDAPVATKIAVVTLALSPVPTLVAKNQLFTGTRAEFAVSLTIFSSAAAVVLTPLMSALVGAILDEPLYVKPGALALRVLGFIVLPLALGIALRRVRPETAERVRGPALRVAQVGLAIAVVVLVVVTWDEILAAAAPSTLALIVAFVVAGILVAHAALHGRPDEAHVLATVNFSRHPAIAIGIASTTHPTMEFAAVILLYVVIAALAAAVYRAVVLRLDRVAAPV
ncbi:MAG: hypothetical protein GX593_08905 [Actinomycetales bacterium]|nr:hypothetical protein [Actinomycetales bacterium]